MSITMKRNIAVIITIMTMRMKDMSIAVIPMMMRTGRSMNIAVIMTMRKSMNMNTITMITMNIITTIIMMAKNVMIPSASATIITIIMRMKYLAAGAWRLQQSTLKKKSVGLFPNW